MDGGPAQWSHYAAFAVHRGRLRQSFNNRVDGSLPWLVFLAGQIDDHRRLVSCADRIMRDGDDGPVLRARIYVRHDGDFLRI